MFIIKHRAVFIVISIVLVLGAIGSMIIFGLRFGIDFKGGSLLDVNYTTSRPAQAEFTSTLAKAGITDALIQPIGTNDYSVKTTALTQPQVDAGLAALKSAHADANEKSFTTIGPSVGQELATKSIICAILVILGIIFYIAYAFRGVSKPVSSWAYGLIAIVTLLHDIAIPVGVFVVLSKIYAVDVDTLFVVALLTVLGLSVSDTIVVFDRIRENIRSHAYKTFEETVGNSIKQTFTRSINTSATVILVLLALVFFGPPSTKIFAMMLTAGMFFGTYSSIFLASPLLVVWEKVANKNKKK